MRDVLLDGHVTVHVPLDVAKAFAHGWGQAHYHAELRLIHRVREALEEQARLEREEEANG